MNNQQATTNNQQPNGKIYLVGAGPGDMDYLTIRSKNLITQAEVLVYDALVDDQLFKLVPTDCLKFDVGKRGGYPSTNQTEINQLLVEQCQKGKQVVRLKSGDPFIFGRASSEIQALIAANCPFEVVPGISSALAAPLLAGIPLTDPVLSHCFAVLTAHQPEELDWEALARIHTLAILMGGRHLEIIVYQLQRYGRSPQTPIALIRACGRPQQQVWMGTLADIVEKTAGVSLSPVVIVVGEVVRLRDYLRSPVEEQDGRRERNKNSYLKVDMQPIIENQSTIQVLNGKTVLVTRSAEQSSQFTELLQQEGATVIEMPALVITPPSNWDNLDRAIANLADFDWLILTSSNGVDSFFERLLNQGKDTRALAGIKIAVVGKKTAASLKQYSLQPDFIPPNFVADSLVEHFPEPLTNKKVLFPRVETGGREILVKELSAQGADVIEVPAYQSACPREISPSAWDALQSKTVDIITFASSKTVNNFYHLVEEALNQEREKFFTPDSLLEDICIASIGPQTSKTCHKLLGRVDVEAKEYTLEGLTQAIMQWVNGHAFKWPVETEAEIRMRDEG